MATINGTFNTLIAGTLAGTVATPGATGPAGPAGVGVPAGGLTGQILSKSSNLDYATAWTTLSLSDYLTKSDNLGSLTNFATARSNLSLGTLNTPVFAGVTAQGSGANVANLTPSALSITHTTFGNFTIQPSSGITFPDATVQTTAFNASVLLPYAPLLSPVFIGNPTAPTPAFGDNDTTIATTAFVQAGLLGGTANARNLEVYVRNQSGSTIPAGSIVYISGATGNRPLITLAQANNDANSAQTMGFTKTAIVNNDFGYVIVRGELENINTSALTEGVQLYLSPTTPGTWTTTKPSAPQHLVYVGIVVRAHPTQGVILVAVQNGYELNELHDVKITSVANGQVLKYDSAQNLWVNGTVSGSVAWGGITGSLSAQTDLVSALAAKYDASNPSGFITSSALAPYLTTATAASTYQTLSGMSSYLTTSSAASTYQTQAGMSSYLTTSAAASTYLTQSNAASTYQTLSGMSDYLAKSGNLSGLASTSTARTNLGLGSMAVVNDAPSDGNQYARKNGAWDVVSGGGSWSGGAITSPITYTSGIYVTSMENGYFSVTESANTGYSTISPGDIRSGSTGSGVYTSITSSGVVFPDSTTQSSAAYIAGTGNLNLSGYSLSGVLDITFSDSTTQSTAGIPDAPSDGNLYSRLNASWSSFSPGIPEAPNDGNYYVRKNGAWYQCTVASIYDSNSTNTYNCLTV